MGLGERVRWAQGMVEVGPEREGEVGLEGEETRCVLGRG